MYKEWLKDCIVNFMTIFDTYKTFKPFIVANEIVCCVFWMELVLTCFDRRLFAMMTLWKAMQTFQVELFKKWKKGCVFAQLKNKDTVVTSIQIRSSICIERGWSGMESRFLCRLYKINVLIFLQLARMKRFR